MTSWRDDASAQAQKDLDGLLGAALGFAQQQLETHGEFFPYAAAIGSDGQAELVAAQPDDDEHPASADVIDACIAALISKRDHLRAGAIVADVHVRELDSDAIRVDLEHSEGHALTILLPHTPKRAGNGVDYGSIQAQPGQTQIWA